MIILFGACGDEPDERAETNDSVSSRHDQADYVDALAGRLLEGAGFRLGESATTCLATAIIETATVEGLNEAGITPEDLARGEGLGPLDLDLDREAAARDLADALGDCPIAAEVKPAMVGALGEGEGEGLSESNAACVTDNVDDAALVEALADTFLGTSSESGRPALIGPFVDAMRACPGALTDLIVAPIAADTGHDVSPEGRTCIEGYLTNDPQAVERFEDQGADALLTELAGACPSAFGA